MPSRSGQANEAGSVHRRGVAVFLAAHGLSGRPVAAAEPGPGHPTPVALAFETNCATDDLLCTLSDGTQLFISAKRACGNDSQFADTVDQWLEQVHDLKAGDRLVLAVAEPKGIIRDLGDALRRRREAPASVYNAKEVTALAALRARMSDCAHDVRERVLDAAVVLTIDASRAGRPHHELACSALEGSVVAHGDGSATVSHLESHLHTQAGSAYSGDIDSWVRHLVDVGLVVHADRFGPAGAAIRTRQVAVEGYRASLRENSGRIDLSLLADDVNDLAIPDMADHLQGIVIESGSEPKPLVLLARRRHRLLVEGLPGSGKTAATTELAARWAEDPRCPLPILVRLRDVSRRCSSQADVTLSLLCELAARQAPPEQRDDLVQAMQAAVAVGNAVLLLDGLDECLDRSSMIVQGLSRVLTAIHDDAGVVLTTRPSRAEPGRRLGLAAVRLATPSNLDSVVDRLLTHLASARVPEAERAAWVVTRAQIVRGVRRSHKGLEAVPLLSVLVTLIVADHGDTGRIGRGAGILHEAVTQTVERWERRRPLLPDGAPSGPTNRQLLIGFETVGHLLSERGVVPIRDVDAALTTAMVTRWGLSHEPAREVAREIRRFWDEVVGVFIIDDSATVVARSRVFAEIGAAMHCTSLPTVELGDWVSAAVTDPDRHMALLLSTQLDPRGMDELLRACPNSSERARLGAAAVRAGADLLPHHAEQLLHRLRQAAESAAACQERRSGVKTAIGDVPGDTVEGDGEQVPSHGPVWTWAAEIAALRLPATLERHRRDDLAALPMAESQHAVAQGMAALASADGASRPLTGAERDAVLGMLAVPLPPKRELQQVPRKRVTFPASAGLLGGLGRAVIQAATRLPELGDGAVEPIAALARRSTVRDAREITAVMHGHGHHLDIFRLPSGVLDFLSDFPGDDPLDAKFLSAIAEVADDQPDLSEFQRWRMPDVCDFLGLVDIDEVGLGDFKAAAFEDDDRTRQIFIYSVARAAGMNPSLIATQAGAALESVSPGDQSSIAFDMSSAWPDREKYTLLHERLSPSEKSATVELLGAKSDWIASFAAELLWRAREPNLRAEISALFTELTPQRRCLAGRVYCSIGASPGGQAEELFQSGDPALRRAAARISRDADGDPALQSINTRALADDDLSVRLAASGRRLIDATDDRLPPMFWSCARCSAANGLDDEDCRACRIGSRP